MLSRRLGKLNGKLGRCGHDMHTRCSVHSVGTWLFVESVLLPARTRPSVTQVVRSQRARGPL
jgi:hypothetical protein